MYRWNLRKYYNGPVRPCALLPPNGLCARVVVLLATPGWSVEDATSWSVLGPFTSTYLMSSSSCESALVTGA